MFDALLAALLAFAFALALVPAAARVATARGLTDAPSGWKAHTTPTPYLGGVAVLIAAALASVAVGDTGAPWQVLGGIAVLAALGVVDDAHQLGAVSRLLVEALAGAGAWWAGAGWELTGNDAVDLALTIFWVVAVINALNFLDLMDGVAATAAAASLAVLALLAADDGNHGLAAACLAVGGACAGFLPFNLARPSRIFLGDGGTMPIGFIVAVAAMVALSSQSGAVALGSAFLVFAVPLSDLGYRVISRIRRGDSVMTPGPDSLANKLDAALGSPRRVSAVVAVSQVAVGLSALAMVALA